MKKAPVIKNEEERLKKLHEYNILDSLPSEDFDHITRLASHICECPIALVSLVDNDRQWFKSKVGLDAAETPRDISYCGHAIENNEVFVVEDVGRDERFKDNPLFLNPPYVRFYAGAPLTTPGGHNIGTLCVIDSEPRKLTDYQLKALGELSKLVVSILEKSHKNEKLTALKRQYEDVQSMSATGGWELCLLTNKTTWSKEVYNIHGIPYGKSPDKVDAISFFAPHDRPRIEEVISKCATEGIEYDEEFEFYNKQGVKRWVRAIGRPVRESDGSIKKLIGTFQDITEKVETEKALARSSKMASIGQLAAGVGHEINNPLAIIRGYVAKTLKQASFESDEVRKVLSKINDASERIENIVAGLRTFARIEEDSSNDNFNVYSLFQYMEGMLKEIYQNDGVDLTFDLSSLEPETFLSGGRGKFEQVLINLIANAKDATEGKKKRFVRVEAKNVQGKIFITISDNGNGVPDEIKERIFDPFFTTKDVGKGTGIGLSLVHKFINNDFNGKVSLDNTSDYVGASFNIEVPCASNASEKISHKISSSKHYSFKAIIADDEEDIRELLEMLLEDFGIETKTFKNGKLALEEFKKNPNDYDLIVSDMKMPVMDGPTFLKELRSLKYIEQPTFFFTTGGININFEDKENELNSLIDGYFYKPFDEEAIIDQLEKVFSKKLKKSA